MAIYLTRTNSGTLSTSYTTMTSNFGDSNLSLNVPQGVSSIKSISMGVVTTSGAGVAEVSISKDVDIPVQAGQTMSIKIASTVSSANTDSIVELCFA